MAKIETVDAPNGTATSEAYSLSGDKVVSVISTRGMDSDTLLDTLDRLNEKKQKFNRDRENQLLTVETGIVVPKELVNIFKALADETQKLRNEAATLTEELTTMERELSAARSAKGTRNMAEMTPEQAKAKEFYNRVRGIIVSGMNGSSAAKEQWGKLTFDEQASFRHLTNRSAANRDYKPKIFGKELETFIANGFKWTAA